MTIHDNTAEDQAEIVALDKLKAKSNKANTNAKNSEKSLEIEEDLKSFAKGGGGPNKPGGFTSGRDGFKVGCTNRKGNEFWTEKIGHAGMKLIRQKVSPNDEDKNEVWVTVGFTTPAGIEKEVTVPFVALSLLRRGGSISKDTPDPFSLKGYPFPAKPAHCEIIANCMLTLYKESVRAGTLETVECVSNSGWHTGQDGITEFIGTGHDKYAGDEPITTQVKGDPEIWKAMMAKLLTENHRLGVMQCMAVGGYLKEIIMRTLDISPFFHMYDDGERGKTLAMQVTATWQTSMKKNESNVYDGASSKVGMEIMAQACNNAFMQIDEIGVLLKQQQGRAVETLMFITNGGNRMKGGGPGGGLAKGIRSWDNTFISSGNMSMKDTLPMENEQYNACLTRIIELNTEEYPLWDIQYDSEESDNIKETLLDNHGHGLKLATEYILEHKEELKAKALKWEGVFKKSVDDGYDLFGQPIRIGKTNLHRLPKTFAMCRIALDIIQDVLNIKLDKTENELCRLFNEKLRGKDADEIQADMQTDLLQFFFTNMNHFLVRGFLHEGCTEWSSNGDQKKTAKDHTAKVISSNAEIWGSFKQNHEMKSDSDFDGGILCVNSNGIREAKKKGINIEKLFALAKREGTAILPESGRGEKKVVAGAGRCLCFRCKCGVDGDGLDCEGILHDENGGKLF